MALLYESSSSRNRIKCSVILNALFTILISFGLVSCTFKAELEELSKAQLSFVEPFNETFSNNTGYEFKLKISVADKAIDPDNAVLEIFEGEGCIADNLLQTRKIKQSGELATASAVNLENGKKYSARAVMKFTSYVESEYSSVCSDWVGIDTQEPNSVVVTYPSSDTYTSLKEVTAAWNQGTDNGISGLADTPYRLHLYELPACAGPASQSADSKSLQHKFKSLTHGISYSVQVSTVDKAGNESPFACSPYTEVDVYAPAIKITDTTSIDGYSRVTNPQVSFENDSAAAYWCITKDLSFAPDSQVDICPGGGGTQDGWYTSRPSNLPLGTTDGPMEFNLWIVRADGSLISNKKVSTIVTLDRLAPGAFTVAGVGGTTDVDFDAWFTAPGNPTIKWGSSIDAVDYKVDILSSTNTLLCSKSGIEAPTIQHEFESCASLVNGNTYKVHVTSYDVARNPTSAPEFTFVVDRDPPAPFTISGVTGGADSSVDAFLGTSLPVIHYGASTAATFYQIEIRDATASSVICSLGSINAPATSFDYSTELGVSCIGLLHGGTYRVYVTAKDDGQNATLATNNGFAFRVDTLAPTISIDTKPNNPTPAIVATLDFTDSDALSGIRGTQCSINGAAFTDCVSPKTYSGLTEGSHTFEVKAIDYAGNEATSTYTWFVDLTNPSLLITSRPPLISNNPNVSFSFYATDLTAIADYQCSLNLATFTPCSSPWAFTVAEGTHHFSVRARDLAGFTDEKDENFLVDLTAPTVTLTAHPPSVTGSTSASFSYSAVDTGGSGVSHTECHMDNGTYAACSNPQTYSGLADGSHDFFIRTYDIAGNVSSVVSYNWWVYTAGPTATITSSPAALTNDTTALFAFTAAAPPGVSIAGYECSLDGAAYTACISPTSFYALANGPHVVYIRVTDSLGNTGPVTSYNWTIDTFGPTTTILTGPTGWINVDTASFTFSAVDSGGSTVAGFQCSLDGAPYTTCTSGQSYSSLSEAAHSFSVRSLDALGNIGSAVIRNWSTDYTIPTLALTATPATISGSSSASFSFTTDDGSGSGIAVSECSLDGGAYAACTSPHSLTALADGPHSFSVRTIDNATNVSAVKTHNWTIYTTGPTVTIGAGPVALTNDTNASFSFTAAPHPGTSVSGLQCSLDGGAYGACESPHGISGLTHGPHTMSIRATDTLGITGTAAVHSWTVDLIGPTTTITGGPSGLISANSASFTFSAVDTGGSTVASYQCSLDGGAYTACSSGQTYSSLSEGAHSFAVRAVDAFGNIGSAVTRSITTDYTAPSVWLTSTPANPSDTGSTALYFSYSDANGVSAVQCQLDGGAWHACGSPAGYTVGAGGHSWTVLVTDNVGRQGSASFSWTVYSYFWNYGGWGACDAPQPGWATDGWTGCDAPQPAFTYDGWGVCTCTDGLNSYATRGEYCPVNYGNHWRNVWCPTSYGNHWRSVWCQRSDGAAVADAYCGGGKPAANTGCSRADCAGGAPANYTGCSRGGGGDCHSQQSTTLYCGYCGGGSEGGSCFTGETMIELADGSKIAIDKIRIGDKVRSTLGNINTVLDVERVPLANRLLVGFNGEKPFFTPEHPFLTREGWKSMKPDETFAEHGFRVAGVLKEGDYVLHKGKWTQIRDFKKIKEPVSKTVYNLILDGDHSYIANDYGVHNKN